MSLKALSSRLYFLPNLCKDIPQTQWSYSTCPKLKLLPKSGHPPVFPISVNGTEVYMFNFLYSQHLWRTDAFELWCWRRLLRVPWTARRANQSILKGISPEYSLGRLMVKMKQYFGHLIAKNWLYRKDPEAGKDWRQEEGIFRSWKAESSSISIPSRKASSLSAAPAESASTMWSRSAAPPLRDFRFLLRWEA